MKTMLTTELNKVSVFVTKSWGCDFSGYFYTVFKEEAVPFAGFAELLMLLEQQFDRYQLPQATHKMRCFGTAKKKQNPVSSRPNEVEVYLEHTKSDKSPILAQFTLHVLYRQNGSWQGRITWTKKGQVENFRSAIELLYLLLEVLNSDRSVVPVIGQRFGIHTE